MSFQVDQCKHFKDGKVCSKCGRMMPAYCKDQEELEEKARLFDELVASGKIETVKTEKVVEGNSVSGPAVQQATDAVSDGPAVADTPSEQPEASEAASVEEAAHPVAVPKTKGRRKGPTR